MIVLDTHIWFWLITQEFERFPETWETEIATAKRVGVSCISCYEIALAHSKKRLELPCPTDVWLHEALEPSGIDLLPFTEKVAYQAVMLSPIHKDPFDRIIIATALSHQAKLASVDKVFPKYDELKGYLMTA